MNLAERAESESFMSLLLASNCYFPFFCTHYLPLFLFLFFLLINLYELITKFICRRHDLTEGLKKLPCKTLIFVGDCSPFHTESVYMNAKMEKKICALVEVGLSPHF